MNAAERYLDKLRRVLDYIDAHLDEDICLERLSAIATFSKFHFHRQFSELLGIGVYKYVQLARLKRASYQLAFRTEQPVIDIALESGYDAAEAFARAFKKTLGQTPSEFRRSPNWIAWHATYEPLRALRSEHMTTPFALDQVKIVDFKAVQVAVLPHRGDPRRIGDSIRRFIEWRKQNHLPPRSSATYNILYDDPDAVPADAYRFDLCAATQREITPNDQGIVAAMIPHGRCAVLRFTGSDDLLSNAVRFLYSQWLPQSGEELRDFPLFLQRVQFFPDVPEHEAVVDVFLPLKE